MITIPQLDPNSHLLDTDVVMITHSDGTTDKITGADLKSEVLTDVPDFTDDKIQNGDMNPVTSNAVSTILASSRIITGPVLGIGGNIKILFTDNIMGSDTSTPLTITYNGSSKAVKMPKDGALVSIYAQEVATNTYRYIQKYTTIEIVYDSVDFIVVSKTTSVIENGNLNPVSGEAVAGAISKIGNLSSTPVVIGKWTDGVNDRKRITFTITFTLNQQQTSIDISDYGIAEAVNISGIISVVINGSQNIRYNFPLNSMWDWGAGGWKSQCYINHDSKTLIIQRGSEMYSRSCYGYVTIEYV